MSLHTEDTIRNYIDNITEDHEIIKALIDNKLCIFFGAGASMVYGMPGWREFSERYLDYVIRVINKKELIINHYTKQKLLQSNDHLQILSICESLVNLYNIHNERKNFLKETFCIPPTQINGILAGNRFYNVLKSINAKYITTNYDNLFDHYVQNELPSAAGASIKTPIASTKLTGNVYGDIDIIREQKQLAHIILDGDVVHIHGCISKDDKCDSLIITREDYLKRYYNLDGKENAHNHFLSELFNTYTVLFIGYGLQELEILKYMFKNTYQSGANKRYIILEAYPSDYEYIKIYENYLGQYNVNIIPYDMTDFGYQGIVQLLDKIRDTKVKLLKPISDDLDLIMKGNW